MSLSISNSESAGPATVVPNAPIGKYHEVELRLVKRLCWATPIVAFLAIPVIHHYLMTLIYLQPSEESWRIADAYRSKAAIAAALGMVSLPLVWLAGLKLDGFFRATRLPWAVMLALLALISVGVLLEVPRARWFFVEWAKVRTPNPSFARNTLFWEQRNFAHAGSPNAKSKVLLVGSSQTNQGFNLQILDSKTSDDFQFEKNCLAGFGPMQYPFLRQRIAERGAHTIVCHLSEFDFYREDVVPIERLRWAASLDGTRAVASTISPSQRWHDRASLADLVGGSFVTTWRLRDHFRRVAKGYWWNRSLPTSAGSTSKQKAGPVRLAHTPDLEQAIEFLKQNVGHKAMVRPNFEAFALFAKEQRAAGTQLIVLEGQVHPTARAAYDHQGLQLETRKRMRSLSQEFEFQYYDSTQMPNFDAGDFADAYHLNEQGQRKISTFLASKLKV